MSKKRGRPTIYTRTVVRGHIRAAKKQNVSLRQYCADNGLSYISIEVAKGRYMKRNGQRTRKVVHS